MPRAPSTSSFLFLLFLVKTPTLVERPGLRPRKGCSGPLVIRRSTFGDMPKTRTCHRTREGFGGVLLERRHGRGGAFCARGRTRAGVSPAPGPRTGSTQDSPLLAGGDGGVAGGIVLRPPNSRRIARSRTYRTRWGLVPSIAGIGFTWSDRRFSKGAARWFRTWDTLRSSVDCGRRSFRGCRACADIPKRFDMDDWLWSSHYVEVGAAKHTKRG